MVHHMNDILIYYNLRQVRAPSYMYLESVLSILNMEARHISKLRLPSHSVAKFSLVNKIFNYVLMYTIHTNHNRLQFEVTIILGHNNFRFFFFLSFLVAISFIFLSYVPSEILGDFIQKIISIIVPQPKEKSLQVVSSK